MKRVHFTGRLATYKYYNMDQVVAQSLKLFKTLNTQHSPTEIDIHANGNGSKVLVVPS
jgi:UDP-galactopyranose mutase